MESQVVDDSDDEGANTQSGRDRAFCFCGWNKLTLGYLGFVISEWYSECADLWTSVGTSVGYQHIASELVWISIWRFMGVRSPLLGMIPSCSLVERVLQKPERS